MIEGELYADQVLQRLKDEVRRAGSQQSLANTIGISSQHLNDMLKERRAITGKALEYLDLYPMTIYMSMR